MHSLVSIIIPAYNAEKWIAATLRSALDQTWPRKEVIVVDDGSTDGTLAVARRFESAPVKIVTQPNRGAAAARNHGFRLSQGDYIQWLDADDLLAPDKIAAQMAAAQDSGGARTLLSSAWGRFRYRPAKARFVPTALWSDLDPISWLVLKLERNIYMPDHAWLVSRELTAAAGPWEETLSVDDDGEYFCRVILKSEAVRFVGAAKAYYRISGSHSLSHIGANPKKAAAQWRAMRAQIRHLRATEDSPRVRAACREYLESWLIYFYPERPEIVREMGELLLEVDGRPRLPELSWKYSWIKTLFGWGAAKYAMFETPLLKARWNRLVDLALSKVDNPAPGPAA